MGSKLDTLGRFHFLPKEHTFEFIQHQIQGFERLQETSDDVFWGFFGWFLCQFYPLKTPQ